MRDTARSEPDRTRPRDRRSAPPEPSHEVLELQRTVGNRAARTVLAREPVEADTKRESTIEIEGLGTIPLLSYSFGVSGSGKLGRRGEEQPVHPDLNVTTAPGAHTPKLSEAAAKGKPFPTVVIKGAGVTITLKNAFVSGYSSGGGGAEPTEQWSLSYESIEYKYGSGG